MKKICFVTASPLTLRAFMRNHLKELSAHYEVAAVADFTADDLREKWLPGIRMFPVAIARPLDIPRDLIALRALARYFRSEKFDAVHSITPKAGLLAMMSARLAGVPKRIHCYTGQVWATRSGVGRLLLKSADRLIAVNATHILADSRPQRTFLEAEGVLKKDSAVVLGRGSIAGVDLGRFKPDPQMRAKVRAELGIPQNARLLLFVGRLNRDKGILDLAEAFARLPHGDSRAWLVVVGPDEADIGTHFEGLCGASMAYVRRVDYTQVPEHYMAAADVFVLPSYREGFNNVVMEAAACGVPAVASKIYGLTDVVVDGVTGLLHPPGDSSALYDAVVQLLSDDQMRMEMGRAASARVKEHFTMEALTGELLQYYEKILNPDLDARGTC